METLGSSTVSKMLGSSAVGTSGVASGVTFGCRATADGVSNTSMFADTERESLEADLAVDACLDEKSATSPPSSSSSAMMIGLAETRLTPELTRLAVDVIISAVSSSSIFSRVRLSIPGVMALIGVFSALYGSGVSIRGPKGVFLEDCVLLVDRAELRFPDCALFSVSLSGVVASLGLLAARVDVGVEPKRKPKVTSCTSVVLPSQ
jgi:hypothetical protein